MGTKIGKEKIQREKGYLYFIGKDGYVWAAPMKHNKTGKKKKVGTEKIAKESGFNVFPAALCLSIPAVGRLFFVRDCPGSTACNDIDGCFPYRNRSGDPFLKKQCTELWNIPL